LGFALQLDVAGNALCGWRFASSGGPCRPDPLGFSPVERLYRIIAVHRNGSEKGRSVVAD